MSRAEKRRQQKKAATATKNTKPLQNSIPSPRQQHLTVPQALDLGVQHHNAGRLPEAERIYQRILQADPNQPIALNLLGVIAHQVGRNDVAVDLITKALAIKPKFAEAHSNLGAAFQELRKLNEAVASFHKALAIKPKFAEAHSNLGLALQELGKPDDAVASFHKALAIRPGYAEAHSNLGVSLNKLGRLDDAVASFHKALAIKPDYAEAHSNLGLALQELGQLDEAVASFHKALAIKPKFAEAHSNLGLALQELGQLDEAFRCFRHAVSLDPQNDLSWAALAAALETFSFDSIDDNLYRDLLHLLDRAMVVPSRAVLPVISALRHHSDFSRILELTGSGKPEIGIAYEDIAGQLSSIPLFLKIMGLSPIHDLKIERMLVFLRGAMIMETMAGEAGEKGLPFSASLALQCFANEYVFSETDEEEAAVDQIQQQIAMLLKKERDVPPSLVATLGAFRPLFRFPWAQELCEREWKGIIKEVIERQVSEPLEEQILRSRIPCLTTIQETVSKEVREQYEENPYPRWIKTGIGNKGRSIGAVLQGAPLHLDLGDYQSPESPKILMAGCGTGQHALTTVSNFSNARVLAVDLSLSSLSYAIRKTKEFGFSNFEYAQADIMELENFGRQFDLIGCTGVLHHLGDPVAGWRILVDLLRPGGLMKIGLYSEAARQDIISGRSLIAKEGYTSSPEDIRRCRQDIITKAENGNPEMANICNRWDFFSLSTCRDLLFNIQEHRFTIPEIEAALTSLKLKFLGFEMRGQTVLKAFTKSHPSKRALTSLSLWHKFELKNPDTFKGMYQFWCKRM